MDTAYANIGLDANTTWRDVPGDGFQKCSDKLWVKLNYLKEKKHHQVGEKGKVVTVHDVILQSKLAQYGNYSYDNDREMMYNREKPLQFSEELTKLHCEEPKEPWMLTEVEQEFRRLTRNCSQPYDLYNGFKPVDCVEVEESIQKKYPVLAKKCQPHTIDTEETLETIYLPNPFYRIDDLNQLELQMRITSTKHIWEYPVGNLMSFINNQKHGQHLRCATFPEVDYSAERSSIKTNHPSVLPPSPSPSSQSPSSQTPFVSSFRIIESVGDLSVRRSIRTSSRASQSTESKTDILPVVKKKSSSDGHDFSNLTLLTRPVNRHETSVPEHSSFQVPETVLKWLQTGYPTRSKEFSTIQNLSDELRSIRSSLQGSSIAAVSKDRRRKLIDESFGGKKCEFLPETTLSSNIDNLVYRSENLSTALSSISSSEQDRNAKAKFPVSPVSNVSCSAASPGGLTCSWHNETTSLWPSKTFNLLGVVGPPDLNLSRDNVIYKLGGKTRFKQILNSLHKELSDEENLGFEEVHDKKQFNKRLGDMRLFQCCGDSSFDDLERQAIEQWPSDESMDILRSKNLQTIRTKANFVCRTNNVAKRKSAVQILQETKAFYVKSETVLDKKQEFRPGKVTESAYGNFLQNDKSQKCLEKNNKLQDKLRILLDFDSADTRDAKKSVEHVGFLDHGAFDTTVCFQHKSLPDLHISPSHLSGESSDSSFDIKYDGDSRSAYSSITQPERPTYFSSSKNDCVRCGRSANEYHTPEFQADPRIYSSFRMFKSGENVNSKASEERSSYRRRSSIASSGNRSRHNSSSKHSQSADSGRQSQGGSIGLRTGRSGLPEVFSLSKSTWSDSGTEDDSLPLFRNEGSKEKKRPILRSKSDITYKYCANKPKLLLPFSVRPCLPTTEKLEIFFDHLGMDPIDFKELASDNSGKSSPVFFSSVSSIDSCADVTSWSLAEPYKAIECPSIVERNARIIKWLYNCQRPVVGKFYARQDFVNRDLDDPSIEESIVKRDLASSKEKYKDCLTTNMQYGWYIEPQLIRPRYNFFFPKRSSWITQIGAVIAKEDEKNPKKPFTGVAFKV